MKAPGSGPNLAKRHRRKPPGQHFQHLAENHPDARHAARRARDFPLEIRNIESDDTTRLADDRRRKHMPVIWIRQVHGIDQWFIARDQSVQDRSIHQLAGPHEIGTLKAWPLFQQITNPFVMHPVAPSRPKKLCLGEKQNEAAQACPIKDICIKKCCEGGNHASIQFQPACLRSHFRQGQFSLLGRSTLIGQKISKAHTAMPPHHAM